MKTVYSMDPPQLDEYFQRMGIYFQAIIIVENPEDREMSYLELENYLGEYSQISDNNDISDIMNYAFSTGTVLQMAIEYGRIDLIPLFIQHGADINLRNSDGLSAIDIAVLHKAYAIIELLIPNETQAGESTVSGAAAANITQVDDEPRVVYSSLDIALNQLRLRVEESISQHDYLGKAGDYTS